MYTYLIYLHTILSMVRHDRAHMYCAYVDKNKLMFLLKEPEQVAQISIDL